VFFQHSGDAIHDEEKISRLDGGEGGEALAGSEWADQDVTLDDGLDGGDGDGVRR